MKHFIFAMMFVLVLSVGNVFAWDVELGWEPPIIEDQSLLQLYEVGYGTSPGTYTMFQDASPGYLTNSVQILGLKDYDTYYFAVRSVGWNGTMSVWSNEVSWNGLPDTWAPGVPRSFYIKKK